jgi:hypothetical protein
VRPLNECAQSHQGALDRVHAEACVMVHSCAQGRTAGVRLSSQQGALNHTRASVCVHIGYLHSSQHE